MSNKQTQVNKIAEQYICMDCEVNKATHVSRIGYPLCFECSQKAGTFGIINGHKVRIPVTDNDTGKPIPEQVPAWKISNCGECGWEHDCYCRRNSFGCDRADHLRIGMVEKLDPACPAFVAKK